MNTLLQTTIAGSLPKPSWLAEPTALWAPWKVEGAALAEAKRDAVRLAVADQEKAGIDILFVEDPSNMAWLTGYDGWSFYVHQGVLVFPDEDPIWWGRGQDRNAGFLTETHTLWRNDRADAPRPDPAFIIACNHRIRMPHIRP